MYLLDTNIISELRRPRPHGAVVAWLRGIPDEQLRECTFEARDFLAAAYLALICGRDAQAGVHAHPG